MLAVLVGAIRETEVFTKVSKAVFPHELYGLLCERWETLTISDQDQGALGFGLAIMDLNSICALIGSGEKIHCHLDDSSGHIVTDLLSLRGIK